VEVGHGATVSGPAVVQESDSTLLILPGQAVVVEANGTLVARSAEVQPAEGAADGSVDASLKDRASAVCIARAMALGAETVTCASTGNAAASWAGAAASVGIASVIFVPATAPVAKVAQLLTYGATVFAVDGTYDDAFDLCLEATERFGWYNRNTAVNPYTLEGKKTKILDEARETKQKAKQMMTTYLDEASDVIQWYREFIATAPDDINGFFAFLTVPPVPIFPEHLHMKKMCGVVWCYVGGEEDAAKAARAARLFDVRRLIGGLFALYGVVLVVLVGDVLVLVGEVVVLVGMLIPIAGAWAFIALADDTVMTYLCSTG